MKILTLTLSPAFDMHCRGQINPGHESLIHMILCQAGGKGVNISRALTHNGCQNQAVLLLGEENQDSFLKNLNKDNLHIMVVSVPGRIRENITVHSDSGLETRISFPGFSVTPDVLSQIEGILLEQADSDTVITMTGRLPEGMGIDAVKAMLRKLADRGAKIVVDSRSFTLADIQDLKPWLIKPNQEEISAYLGKQVDSLEDILCEAQALHSAGITNVMVSMGGEGALLVCADGAFLAKPPKIEAVSTVGAGDSAIAGFLSAAGEKLNPAACLSRAIAYGTAACMTEGTEPPAGETIQKIEPLICVQKL